MCLEVNYVVRGVTVNLGYNESLRNEYSVVTITPHGINYFVYKNNEFLL